MVDAAVNKWVLQWPSENLLYFQQLGSRAALPLLMQDPVPPSTGNGAEAVGHD